MHAIRQYAFGGADELRYEELPDPHPGPGQVRIAVRSAGVHLLDVTIRRGQAPPRIAPDLPMRPGSEVAGVVDEVGSGVRRQSPRRRALLTGAPTLLLRDA
jgi:NADPH2:quinone reductase